MIAEANCGADMDGHVHQEHVSQAGNGNQKSTRRLAARDSAISDRMRLLASSPNPARRRNAIVQLDRSQPASYARAPEGHAHH